MGHKSNYNKFYTSKIVTKAKAYVKTAIGVKQLTV